MNKVFFIPLVVLFSTSIFSQEIEKYNFDLLHVFSTGENGTSLGYSREIGSMDSDGPEGIGFDESGNLIISDWRNKRLVIFNRDYSNVEEFLFSNYSSISSANILEVTNGFILGNQRNMNFFKINTNGDKVFSIFFRDHSLRNSIEKGNYWEYSDYFFQYLKTGELICIPSKKEEENWGVWKILNEDQIRELLNSSQDPELKLLSIDDKKRLFIENNLVTRSYSVFHNYWKEIHGDIYSNPSSHPKKLSFPFEKLSNMVFLGTDNDMNSYWKGGSKWIWIFNSQGWLIEMFEFEYKKSSVYPAINPSGDVYFLDYDQEGVYLYKIPRQW